MSLLARPSAAGARSIVVDVLTSTLHGVDRQWPILTIHTLLEAKADGVQLMKAMPDLGALLAKAKLQGIFGTKMRSTIKHANAASIQTVVDQQFAVWWRCAATRATT